MPETPHEMGDAVTEAEDKLARELEPIGAVNVTFRYPTALAAKQAWERADKRCHRISVWRYMNPITNVMYVTACGEEADVAEIRKAERLLATGGEPCESPNLETLRNRRRQRAIELARSQETNLRSRVRFGERGAVLMPDGSTIFIPGSE